ncbi:SLATT domain-containing protein [Wenzhouxiangella sp. XN201]|uniref:SLATT domain-containing protein n=1 Tax=Wenzhouxiangella sp. XN201 TaxID=2710755 RepID=UPI0013C61F0D|nr:SLATT domain-containing protein [Wenzhouxiangella sp. XN201]NEZ03075.1 SLATT domain-containing protein [Wenzhouxiangella sp. XN201]
MDDTNLEESSLLVARDKPQKVEAKHCYLLGAPEHLFWRSNMGDEGTRLASRIWWTRKARIKAEQRMLRYNAFFNALLLWYSFSAVAASVYYLNIATGDQTAETIWLIFSILVLALAGFMNGFRFKERAIQFKHGYEELSTLYVRLESQDLGASDAAEEYREILALSENHLQKDYFAALCEEFMMNDATDLDREPKLYVVVSYIFHLSAGFLTGLFLVSLPLLVLAAALHM